MKCGYSSSRKGTCGVCQGHAALAGQDSESNYHMTVAEAESLRSSC